MKSILFGFFLIQILIISASAKIKPKKSKEVQITNGEFARENQFPFFASLAIHNRHSGPTVCGGSLIAPEWVLTAAHCIYDAIRVHVGLNSIEQDFWGDRGVQKIPAWTFIRHERYNNTWLFNDIGLIKLSKPAKGIKPVSLPTKKGRKKSFVGAQAYMIGHGNTEKYQLSEQLKFAKMKVVPNEQCKPYYKEQMQETNICALGRAGKHVNACQGDSGGPLVLKNGGKWIQIGVFSFTGDLECINHETGYARVTSYINWIRENTGLQLGM